MNFTLSCLFPDHFHSVARSSKFWLVTILTSRGVIQKTFHVFRRICGVLVLALVFEHILRDCQITIEALC